LSDYEPPELARSLCARPAREGSARIAEICGRASRLIQNRPLELATFNRIHDDEIAEVEAAVCDLWVIEQKNKKASSCKPTLAQKRARMGHPALEQFPRLLVGRSRAGGGKQMGWPQNDDASARGLRAKSIVARGADRPLLENREKWRTPSSFWSTNQDGHKLYSPRKKGPTRRLVGH
jgi:hypothetical protein